MKKNFLFAMAILLSLAAITGSSCKSPSSDKTEATVAHDDISQNPDYQKGLDLVQKNDCLTCHTVASTATGPSFVDIAKKYGQTDIPTLADKIIKGGSGVWGQVPMTPHPTLSKPDAEQIVKYILLLKNQGE